ncbi:MULTISPECIES: hypothetical protein [Arthrobacter]|uniref:hypothetical protein n=1 Tax=Arthrobacter TaxID=1663 RepID=UPI001D145BCE|nr:MULTISPECIES: hypothetical protein [Arthrobacter]MCC3280902.1 hypothetical protein [Arthrobacter caoxuetaonis]MCC9192934.1 hypothetical protein [Arthrobacter sp. zg-Y916]
MEIFLAGIVIALLIASITAVVMGIHNDGRGHLPPVRSNAPWHGNALWDVSDPRDLSLDHQRYQPHR